jgi:hypothetical protein
LIEKALRPQDQNVKNLSVLSSHNTFKAPHRPWGRSAIWYFVVIVYFDHVFDKVEFNITRIPLIIYSKYTKSTILNAEQSIERTTRPAWAGFKTAEGSVKN